MEFKKISVAAVMAVIGILMIVNPKTFLLMGVILIGIAAAVDGIFVLVTTRNLIFDPNFKLMMTIRGIFSVVIGLAAVIFPMVFASAADLVMKVSSITLGAYLLISSGLQIYGISKLHRNGIVVRQAIIEVIFCLILALTLFLIPLQAESVMQIIVRIIGGMIIAGSLCCAVIMWYTRPSIMMPDELLISDDGQDEKSIEN